jgi:hypothetical protein
MKSRNWPTNKPAVGYHRKPAYWNLSPVWLALQMGIWAIPSICRTGGEE